MIYGKKFLIAILLVLFFMYCMDNKKIEHYYFKNNNKCDHYCARLCEDLYVSRFIKR